MKATKDEKTGLWYVQYRYTDWQGNRKKSTKRGFTTKRDAEAWLVSFLSLKQSDITMTFSDFVQLYNEDMSTRLREHTIRNKAYIVNSKILPYFGEMKLNEITATQIRRWQNELLKQDYSKTYLRTINNQLRTLFNYASTYYDLPNNPCKKAGNIGKNNADEMNFWTTEEFKQFADCIMDKQESYTLFTTLFWTGMRIGELLALNISDIDFDRKTISITKSYQRIGNRDVITEPKTPKSIRTIHIPEFLAELLQEYSNAIYGAKDGVRLFPYTKHFITNEMKRGIDKSGVKRIRTHDLRHSHASHLVELGFSPLAIAQRLGHERVETTLNTYSHLYPNKQSELADALEKFNKEVF